MGGEQVEGDGSLPVEAIKRADVLETLRDGSKTRADLMKALDVSRTTIHRIVRDLEAQDLLVQSDDEFELSPFGRAVAAEVSTFQQRLTTARRLQPFLATQTDESVDVDVGPFADATITEPGPSNPYAPVARFMELLRKSSTLYGFDTTTIAPIFVDEIREEILDGMTTDVVYLPTVVDDIVEAYPDAVRTALESGELSLSTHEELPFGLAIFDGRIGLGGYDEQTGMLTVFVDTDNPEARDWALDLYERYREEADGLTPADIPGEP
ncbi:helix-turn-helix transcriptional regulator [Haloarchaeobius amylolyticus]|uniref:helix-turn-helix transcriptional regulator n=1 Tax=Haloarchaeobius amylolyticus TaxID=1198296 RepID=UPI00226FCA96|nr:HTH domain-containing protein [Haloarchaeobius amylolyticus]